MWSRCDISRLIYLDYRKAFDYGTTSEISSQTTTVGIRCKSDEMVTLDLDRPIDESSNQWKCFRVDDGIKRSASRLCVRTTSLSLVYK